MLSRKPWTFVPLLVAKARNPSLVAITMAVALFAGCATLQSAVPPLPKDEKDALVTLKVQLTSANNAFATLLNVGILKPDNPSHVAAVKDISKALDTADIVYAELEAQSEAGTLDIKGDKFVLAQNSLNTAMRLLSLYGAVFGDDQASIEGHDTLLSMRRDGVERWQVEVDVP